MADAETLLEFHRCDLLAPINYELLVAMVAGSYAIEPPTDDPEPEPEYRYARSAARAAFCAVPALKED